MVGEVDNKADGTSRHMKRIVPYRIFSSNLEAVVNLCLNADQVLRYLVK